MTRFKAILVALGSHGDVHPFVGLGSELRRRGYNVQMIANGHFGALIQHAGLTFIEVGSAEEYHALATDPQLWKRLGGTRTVLRSIGHSFEPVYRAIEKQHIPGRTIVIASSLGFGARVAQDHLNVPTITVHLQPSTFFGLRQPPRLPGFYMPRWMPMWMRRAQLALVDAGADQMLGPPLNTLRRQLGLPAVRRILTQYMNSPLCTVGLFPDWFAPKQSDWPPQTHLTGFPLYDESELSPLDEQLNQFLDAGEPPIAFTPGSAMWTANRFFYESAKACQLLGRRGLLLSRHRDHVPPSLPEGVKHVEYAPFSQLLPRCAALVHHGGIGTSAQALAAGCRQLVMPHAHDQPDNAARLARLGVAQTIEPRDYHARPIATKLTALLADESVTVATRQVASRFNGVDSIARTCDLIESICRGNAGRRP